MENEMRCIRSMQEYPGSTIWRDYEVKCPECGHWTEDYGHTSTVIDGQEYWLCDHCAYENEEALDSILPGLQL